MIGTIASKKACGGSGTGINTGKLGCLSLFGSPAHLLALTKGTIIPATQAFDTAYITELVQKGIAYPLVGASAFEDLSSEDSYSTNARGEKRLNVKGLPEYRLTFEEGHEFYRELAKFTSYKRFDYLIGDLDGNWIVGERTDGDYQGLTAGHTTAEITKRLVEGGDPEMKSIVVQFLDRIQFDQKYAILHAEDLEWAPSELPNINGTRITFNAIPVNADTVIDLNVVLASDRSSLVEGLDDTHFVIMVDGITAAISNSAEGTPGNFQLTIPGVTTGNVITVTHWSGSTNTTVADSGGILYRNTITTSATVV